MKMQLWRGVWQRMYSRRFWRVSGLLLSANVIVAVLGLIRVPVITRILTKDEVGMIGVVISVLPFLQLLSLSGLDLATYHYVAKGKPGAFQINVATRLRWSVLSTLGFLMGAAYWLWAGNPTLAGLFVIAALTYPVTTGLTAVAGVLSAKEDFVRLFWYRIAEALTRYAGIVVLLMLPLLATQVLWFFLANQVALAVLQVTVAIWLLDQLRRAKDPPMSSQEQGEVVRYGKHMTALNGISTAQTRVDSLLVALFLPLSVMADYSIAQIVYIQFKNLWTVYYTVRYPPLLRLPLARRRWRMVMETGVVWAGSALVGLVVGAALWVLVPIILPQEYVSSLPFISWLLAAFVIGIPGFFAETYFRTQQDERSQYLLRGAAAVSGVVLPALFFLVWQAYGIVLGRFLSSLVLSMVGVFLFIRDARREPVMTQLDT